MQSWYNRFTFNVCPVLIMHNKWCMMKLHPHDDDDDNHVIMMMTIHPHDNSPGASQQSEHRWTRRTITILLWRDVCERTGNPSGRRKYVWIWIKIKALSAVHVQARQLRCRDEECVFQAITHNCYGHIHRNPLQVCRGHAVDCLCSAVRRKHFHLAHRHVIIVGPLLSSHGPLRCHFKQNARQKIQSHS